MELSFTWFRVYGECPWKFKRLYRDGVRLPPTPAGSLGLALHRALEGYLREGRDDLDLLLRHYRARWVDAGFSRDEERGRWRKKGRRMLEGFFERERARRTRIAGLEREFSFPLGPHRVRGMIDRIDEHPDGRFELIDYKTGGESPGGPGESLQLRFYALGAKEGLGIEPALVSFEYLATGRTTSAAYSGEGEEELKAAILRTIEAMEAGRFEPDTSFCARCGLRPDCAYARG